MPNPECTTCGLLKSTVDATGKKCLPNMVGHNFPNTLPYDWRKEFEKAKKEQYNNGSPYFPDWDAVEAFISSLETRTIQRCIDVVRDSRTTDETLTIGLKQQQIRDQIIVDLMLLSSPPLPKLLVEC